MSKSMILKRGIPAAAALAMALAFSAAVPSAHSPAIAQSLAAPSWFAPSSSNAAQKLVALLATAEADGLNPRRYDAKRLSRLVGPANAVIYTSRCSHRRRTGVARAPPRRSSAHRPRAAG